MSIYLAPTWQMATILFLIPGIFAYTYLGPTFGVVQNMFPTHRRATATAILFFFLNLIALGGGPPFTGWVIDHFASFHLSHPDASGLLPVGGRLPRRPRRRGPSSTPAQAASARRAGRRRSTRPARPASCSPPSTAS